MRFDRHAHAEERRRHLTAEERAVPFIVGVRDESDAGRNQLGPSGFDLYKRRTKVLRHTCAVAMQVFRPHTCAVATQVFRPHTCAVATHVFRPHTCAVVT